MEKIGKKVGKLSIFLSLASVSMVFAVMYSIPYVKSVFYDGMLAITGVSNAKLGVLMTIYGLGEVFTPGIGGILASKYDHKIIILISSIGTAVACALMALFPSFAMALVVWTILVFSTLFMVWGTLFKAIRLIVSDEEQGKISGYFGGFIGVCYLVVNGLCLVIYSMVGGGKRDSRHEGRVLRAGGHDGAVLGSLLLCAQEDRRQQPNRRGRDAKRRRDETFVLE